MIESAFDRERITAFRFTSRSFDPATGEARLGYAFDDLPELVETIRFPGAPFTLDDARAAAVSRALLLLHLIAGVSYYKAAVPPGIVIEGAAIDAATADLMQLLYENGLGEFAYRNGLQLRGKIVFPHAPHAPHAPDALHAPDAPDALHAPDAPDAPHLSLATSGANALAPEAGLHDHALVAIGGGKDSLVSIEALRRVGVAQTVTWIGSSPLIRACAERTGLPTLNITRTLAPALFEYNKRGALNGHIPVTAVNSAILALAALLQGVHAVVFSNERSASYGSLIPGTGEVNHQWSKGWEFEQRFAAHLKSHVAADLEYFSLLRPLSELAVARQFARTDHYDAWFSSCNRNFHILGERPAQRWCGACPKCHFVFLALAPFMPKPRLMAIFGRNLLDEAEQAPGFDALLEYRNHKPFECVGEGIESRAAMAALAQMPTWREDALVARFAEQIRPQLVDTDLSLAPLLVPAGSHGIPPGLWSALLENFGA